MKKIVYLICLTLFLTSCCYSPVPREYLSKETIDQMQINATRRIVREHEKYAKEKYGIELYEDPIVRMHDKVYLVDFAYESKRKVELDEARKIHLDLLNSLLDRFNNDPHYREYMAVYPFKEENVTFMIGYYDEDGMCYKPPYIKITSNRWKNNCLQYFRKGDKLTQPFYEESFEEEKCK